MASRLALGLLLAFGTGVLVLGRESARSTSGRGSSQQELLDRYQQILLQASAGTVSSAVVRQLAKDMRAAVPPLSAQAAELDKLADAIDARGQVQQGAPAAVGDLVAVPMTAFANGAGPITLGSPPVRAPAGASSVQISVTNIDPATGTGRGGFVGFVTADGFVLARTGSTITFKLADARRIQAASSSAQTPPPAMPGQGVPADGAKLAADAEALLASGNLDPAAYDNLARQLYPNYSSQVFRLCARANQLRGGRPGDGPCALF